MKRSGGGGLCLPNGEAGSYVLARFPKPGEAPSLDAWSEDDLASLPGGTRLGLPARHLLAVPVWLQTTEQDVLRELTRAQLERRGLLRTDGAGDEAWEFLPLAEEEGRTLVAAYLVDPELPAALLQPAVADYDAAARFHALPDEAFVFWPEQGGIALAYGRGGEAAFLHFFPGARTVAEVAAEVALLARSLSWEGVVAERPAVHLWGAFGPADAAAAEALFGVPPVVDPDGFRRSLRVPKRALSLVPSPVRAERRASRERSRRAGLLKAGALAYALVLLAVLGTLGWMKWDERRLKAESAELAPGVAALVRDAEQWKALSPAVDPSYYPLEPLLALVQVLPGEMRLTKFETAAAGKLLVVGEGKDAASAFAFLHAIRKDPFLKKWTWTMPQPKVLPSNRAQFQMEASRVGSNP
ncbi:MAG TPA: hypothetical protein VIM58_12045 [Candidatus Methylacidiphilales bacterium]